MHHLIVFGAKAYLWLCICLVTTHGAFGQETGPTNPPPLFSDRTEDQVEKFLANAPPGAEAGSKPGLMVFISDQFSTAHQLAYLIASCACLCLLAPGTFLVYSSLQGCSLTSERVGQLALNLCFLSLAWVLFLYSIAFSRNAHSYDVLEREIQVIDREAAPGSIFIGDLSHSGMQGLVSEWGGGVVRHPMRRMGDRIPHSVFMTFQLMFFLQAAVPLMSIASKQLKNWIAAPMWLLWGALVYAPLCYWTQGGGWLADCNDAGAAIPLHIGVGFMALGMMSFFRSVPVSPVLPAHQKAFVAGSLLFLGGCLLVAACRSVTHVAWAKLDFLNIFLGAVSGLLAWLLVMRLKKISGSADWPLGMISGIVAMTAGSSSISPTIAIIGGALGALASASVLYAGQLRQNFLWYLFAVHGVSGFAGLILVGIFASPEIAGSDIAGKPIVGLIGGNTELLRVQFLSATIAALIALAGGGLLPRIATLIGSVLERLFSGESLREDALTTEASPNA
jgi:Amt family ammonium transporter